MSKTKRKSIIEGSKSGLSGTAATLSPTRRPSVFERLGPGSSSFSSNKPQPRKSGEIKQRSHEKPSASSSHGRESGGGSAAEPILHHATAKRPKKKRSRSREKKEQVADVRSKISFRPSESSGDHKSKESAGHSPSPKRAVQSETRRREPEAKIRSQVAVVTNRLTHSNSKPNEKGSNQSTEDWRTDRSHLDFQEEFILEKKRQQLQRELELEMQKERLLKIHDNVVTDKRVSSSTSTSSSSAASSSSSGSTSSSSSSSSSEGEDNSSSSISSVSCNRGKNKATSKRSTKVVSSLSGSNSEADIVRAKKGNADVKLKKDSHSIKTKSSRVEEREIRRDQPNLAVQERRKKGIVSPPDVHNKAKHSTVIPSNLHINTGTSSANSGKHRASHHTVANQMKGTEKVRKPSNSAPALHKEVHVPSNEGSRNREHSPSPMIPPTQSRTGKPSVSKPTALVKKKHNVDGANLAVHNKVRETKPISRPKPSLSTVSESQKVKHRMTSVDDTRAAKSKASSPKAEVVRGRRTPPQIVRNAESRHSSIQNMSREKRPGRHPPSPPPLPPPPPPPPVHRTSDLDKTKIGRDRRQPNVMDPVNKSSSDSARKGTKDLKERKRDPALNVKNVSRGREDQKDSRSIHPPDSHHGHAKSESDRGRDVGRHRLSDVDPHNNPVDRGRIIEPRGPHSPPRRDRNDGKKSERSSVGSHQQSSRDGIIDRLRDLSRTSVDISGEYRGRRESTGRAIPEVPPEPRSLPEDRVAGKGMVERDRRGRLLPEEPRYGTPDLPDHRRRPSSPPPNKYHSRNVTPPPRPASPAPPPPRHWSRDHPDPRDSDIPYSSDRRKGSSPLSHNHYEMRNYNDVEMYDYGRSDHRGHDHLGHNQRRDAYHSFPPPEPLDIYERDAPQSRQEYGHGDQRRDDYIHSNRWENNRDDRVKVVPEQERLRDNERWHDEDLAAKRKRGRDDPLEKLPLPKRRRGLTPPPVDNQRSSRGVTSSDSVRPTDSRGRKRLSCDSTSSSSRGNNQRTSTTSEAARISKDSTVTQSIDVKDGDRAKRRNEVSKDASSEIRSSRAEENKRKRPRTPDRNDKPVKLRKLSPSKSAKDEKPTEKSSVKDIKPEKIVVEKEITQAPSEKEEIMLTPVVGGKPPSPTPQTTESFSDWTDDDSMDLLNQDEIAQSNVVDSAEKTESVVPVDVALTPSLETNKDVPVVVKEEKNVSPVPEKKKEETSALSKDDKGRRKPKSEGGEDSRGSFEDGGQRERKSRERYRDERGSGVSRSAKSTSRHASLERSSRRRHHDLETADKPRSKAATPISRPRTPVSRPRTPSTPPPRPVAEPTISENAKKQLCKTADNPIIPADDPVITQVPAPKEKVAVALDDYEYDPISDDELEAMMEEPDEKELESEKGSTDAVDVDWASLVRDNHQSQTNRESNKQSVLKKFSPASILYRIGVSAKFAGPELMERINKVMTEEHSTNGGLDHDGQPAKFAFEDEMASFHAVSVAQKKERETILDDIGPYRQALCARRDLQIRRKLCRLKLKESSFSFHNLDLDTFKLSLQLLRQRRNAAVVA